VTPETDCVDISFRNRNNIMDTYNAKVAVLSFRPRVYRTLIPGVAMMIAFSAARSSASGELPPRPPAMINQVTTTDLVVATVNGRPIRSWQVDAHALNSHLSSDDALEDLIDLKLVRGAAVSHGFSLPPGKWDGKERNGTAFIAD
jgi:hypothetical protein